MNSTGQEDAAIIMPSLWKRPSTRARTWDSSIQPDADLRSMFFSLDAIADVPVTPANTPVEGTIHQSAAEQNAFGPPLTSIPASQRAKSLSTATARYRWEQSSLRLSSFQQQPFEPFLNDSESNPSPRPTTPAPASPSIVARRAERKRAIPEHRADCIVPPTLSVGLVTDRPELQVSPTSNSVESTPRSTEQPTGQPLQESAQVMASLNPSSAYRLTGQRSITQEQAKQQQQIIEQKLSRANQPSPPYDFVDLIGKGTFGRVYLG